MHLKIKKKKSLTKKEKKEQMLYFEMGTILIKLTLIVKLISSTKTLSLIVLTRVLKWSEIE